MIVLDSSFLIAFHNSGDIHHRAANSVMNRLLENEYGKALLLEYVFLEVVTVLLLKRDRETAVEVADTLLSAREVEFMACSENFLEVFETFRRQKGPKLSFVDCAVLTVARRYSPGWVATFDRDLGGSVGVQIPKDLLP